MVNAMRMKTKFKPTVAALFLVWVAVSGCIATGPAPRRVTPNDDAADQNYQLGARYYRNGSYELARDRLERALEIDNRMANAHSMLALTLAQLGNDRRAIESFNRSIKLEPKNSDVRNAYAVYLCQQAKYDEAVVQFERAIGMIDNEQTYVMMTNAGVCIAKKPDLDRAEEYFRNALRVRETYGEALIQMAALQNRIDENLRARAFIQRFLSTKPPSASVLYLAIQIETALDDDRAATDYTNQLIREFPESPEARLLLQQSQ